MVLRAKLLIIISVFYFISTENVLTSQTTECENNQFVIKKEVVSTTEIFQLRFFCRNASRIIVYASSKFVVDAGLILTPGEIIIFAPTWQIREYTQIKLDANANDDDGISASLGQTGTPGLPGSNGGEFVGIYKEIDNHSLLAISANGGVGGKGQDYAEIDLKRQFECINSKLVITVSDRSILRTESISDYTTSYTIDNNCCKSVGKVGAGGVGGNAGHIRIFNLNNPNQPTISAAQGTLGEQGKVQCPEFATLKVYGSKNFIAKTPFGRRVNSADVNQDNICRYYLETDQTPTTRCPTSSEIIQNTNGQKSPEENPPIDFYSYVIQYKLLIRDKIDKGEENAEMLNDFYQLIENDYNIGSSMSIQQAIQEFLTYEEQLPNFKNNSKFIDFYETHSKRIEHLIKTKEHTMEYKALIWLYVTLLSKLYSLHRNHDKNLIIDIKNYMNNIKQNIEMVKSSGRGDVINTYKNQYKAEYEQKINEVKKLINNDILVDINATFTSFDTKISSLLTELKQKQTEINKNIDELKEQQEKLKNAMITKAIFGALGTLGMCLSVLGPIGMAAGTIVTVSSSITVQMVSVNEKLPSRFSIPASVGRDIGDIKTTLKTSREEKMKLIEDVLESLENDVKKGVIDQNTKSATLRELSEKKTKLLEEKNKPDIDPKKIDELTDEMTTFAKQKVTKLKKINVLINSMCSKALTALSVGESAVNAYMIYKDDELKIDAVSDSIANATEELKKIEEYKKNVDTVLVPIILKAQEDLEKFEQSLGQKSLASLDVAQWKVQGVLKSFKNNLKILVQGFQVEEQVADCADKLIAAFDLLIDLYERIQNYGEHERFASYITAVQSADYTNIAAFDEKLKTSVLKMQFNLWSNIIIGQYQSVVSAFKQAVFPFAKYYLDDYDLKINTHSNEDLSPLVQITIFKIQTLSSRIEEYNSSSINENDHEIFIRDFNSLGSRPRLFYIWTQQSHSKTIKDLLSGKEVYLLADISNYNSDLNAIKFNKIGIEFRSSDKAVERDLQDKLQKIQIRLKHMGNSFYRCNNDIYEITHPSQAIEYTYVKDGHRTEPTEANNVYHKIRDGNYMLSPYTIWSIQLTGDNFDEIAQFGSLVDIELYGHGIYLVRRTNICTDDLKKYYRSVN